MTDTAARHFHQDITGCQFRYRNLRFFQFARGYVAGVPVLFKRLDHLPCLNGVRNICHFSLLSMFCIFQGYTNRCRSENRSVKR